MDDLGMDLLLAMTIGCGILSLFRFICGSPKVLKKMNPSYGEFKINSLVEEYQKNLTCDVVCFITGLIGYLMLKTL